METRRPIWEGADETTLVRAAQAGDLGAFDILARRYRPAAVVLARQIVPVPEQAEDAAQDALLAAFKALPQLGEAERFAGWLGTIVRHRARRLARPTRERSNALDEMLLVYAPSVAAAYEARETSRAVRCAVEGLPDDVRPAVELYYLHDWDTKRIAEFLSLPLTTVKWRLHAARERLRRTLGPALEDML